MPSTDEEDEETYISATNVRKRRVPRKWYPSDFGPNKLTFFDRASGVNKEFEIGANKPSDYCRAFFDNEIMKKLVEETNIYQQQNASPNVEKTAA